MIALHDVPSWALPRVRRGAKSHWLAQAEISLVTGKIRVVSDKIAAAVPNRYIVAAENEAGLFAWYRKNDENIWELVVICTSEHA